MVISEIMIIGISLYWLRSQYKEEKSGLTKELYGYYKESYNVAVDSLLVDYIIEPALGDKGDFFSFRSQQGKLILKDSITVLTALINTDSTGSEHDTLSRFKINGTIDSAGSESGFKFITSSDSILIRSLRLIIEKSADSITNENRFIAGIGTGPDSVIFVTNYRKRLNENRLNFNPVWIEADSISVNNGSIILEDWTGSLPSAVIEKPGFYIIREILPQIIFSFILVLVSSLAFILAYLSIMKQMRLNEVRNSFISNISHELKTPVSTVKVAIEALKKNNAEGINMSKTEEYLEMAGKEIKRLEILISKVLDHSIIEEDSGILSFEDVDLVSLIDDSLKSLQSRIESAHAIVSFDHPEELIVRGDPSYLQGVILNLLDNSLKYNDGDPEITIRLSANEKYAVISMSDNGPGIPEEYRQKVFEKFFRVPDRDLHNVKGYGLGLSFAHLVVKMHQGSISVKNNATGCTFTIKIPFKQD